MQLAYSLGYVDDPRASVALARLAASDPVEPIVAAAVMSSLTAKNVGQVLDQVIAQRPGPSHQDVVRELLGQAVALGDAPVHVAALRYLVSTTAKDDTAWRRETLSALLSQYLQQHDLASLPSPFHDDLQREVVAARHAATADDESLATRLAALRLLRDDVDPDGRNQAILESLLDPRQPPEVQGEAGGALLRYFGEHAIPSLLAGWNGFSPGTRNRLLTELLQRTDLTLAMLEQAQQQQVDLQFDARRRQQLRDASDERVRTAAAALFASGTTASREELIARYMPSTGTEGNVDMGQQTFQRVCATCHRFSGQGHVVGPDLEALSNKSVDFLLTAIFDPNLAVESNFLDFTVETVDGRQFSGILQGETANSVTLLAADAKEQSILRADIEVLHATGKSLMPEGLEKDITPTQMCDLLAYLRSFQPTRKSFAGNQPQVAPRRDDGSIRLLAMHAEIYGPSLVFEDQYRNLGFWGSPSDYAAWTVEVPRAGRYSVSLEYACDAGTAGNRFVIQYGDEQIEGEITSTGTWDDYGWKRVGTLSLPAGRSRVTLRGDSRLHGYLMDLHQIVLQPRN